jgi:hypothetical protein
VIEGRTPAYPADALCPYQYALDASVSRRSGGVMEEKELQQRFHLLQQEVEAAISLIEEVRLNYTAAVDALKIEVEVLRQFLDARDPDFARHYDELRWRVIHEISPEWAEPGSKKYT